MALRPQTRAWHEKGRWYPHAQKRPEALLIRVCAVQSAARYSEDSASPSKLFTIFEGTSEIQRMLIGRAVTGLDVRYPDLRIYLACLDEEAAQGEDLVVSSMACAVLQARAERCTATMAVQAVRRWRGELVLTARRRLAGALAAAPRCACASGPARSARPGPAAAGRRQ